MKWIKNSKDAKDDVLKPGAVFEKYTVVKQLGQGGMGSVYLVRHNVLDSLFALKILASDVASRNKQFVDRFIREAKLACKIRHPNLIAVHDAGQNPKNGLYYIVMDYVSGGSVRDLLKKTPRIPPAQALEIITQVADALTAACAHHMVHRDIKPDNIMFAADGSVKLADLGIAKSTDEQDTMITMAASVFGTPAYMSPEQARDSSKVDSRADIYSLGIVFYEMLSGQRPFSGSTAIQILSQVMDSSSTPDIRQICPDVPPDLALLISRMSDKNLEKRFQNPDVLLQELKKIRIPPQIGRLPLRTRDEIATASPVSASAPQASDVTMPTMATDVSAPAPEATMPTMATAPSVPASEPVVPAPAPAAPEPEASAPEATMPTMATAPSVPASEPVVPAPAPAVPEPEAPAPEFTMPTMAAPASVPEVQTVPAASAPSDPKPAPGAAAPVPAAAEKTEPSPAVSSPQNKKRGILIVAAVAACFIILSGASVAAFLMFGRSSTSPEPAPNQDPAAVSPSGSVTPSGGTSSAAISDSTVATSQPGSKTGTRKTPDAGPVADNPAGLNQPESIADVNPPVTEEMTSDPLGNNQIVLLADTSDLSRKTKEILSRAFGAENVSFQEAEGMGSYKQLLKTVIRSDPSVVVICFAQQYAEDGVSASGYESVIGNHADQFQENGVPFLFVQPSERGGNERMRPFLDATRIICQQRSVPLVGAEDLTDEKLIAAVREIKK